MQELSLNILDIAQNSVKAGATRVDIELDFKDSRLTVVVRDNGCGMDAEQLAHVTDPFFTSRTTRRVGLGVPFFKMAAEQTGGSFDITSEPGVGTCVTASFDTGHIDCLPVGDMTETFMVLITCNEHMDFFYRYATPKGEFCTDTVQLKDILEGVPLSEPDVAAFVRQYIKEHTEEIKL